MPPYTEDLVPQRHVETTAEHVKRYRRISQEIEKRFGVRTRKSALTGA